MTPARPFRVLFLGSMLGSMAVVIVWSGYLGWRMWPEWRAVREMRRAVEANEPGRFLDAVEAVDQLGVAEAAADEIAPLCHHAEPRVRMYAVMARTVLGPRGPSGARELIALFDDSGEDINLRCTASRCLVLFGDEARAAVPSLRRAMMDVDDPRTYSATTALVQLGEDVTRPLPPVHKNFPSTFAYSPNPNSTRREMADGLLRSSDFLGWLETIRGKY